jgi:nucleoside-diphosphate-sugar epimerase
MRYLITGGAGFIGSNLAQYVLARGGEVVVLDNFATGLRENLEPILDRIVFIEGDIRDRAAVSRAMEGCSVVFHEGALGSVPRSIVDPITSHDVNVNGTLAVLESARMLGVKRIVFAASSSTYGDQPLSPKHEDMIPLPKSPYAASKTACEHYMRVYAAAYGLETICLRYFNVFGPRQDPFGDYPAVIPAFASAILRGNPLTIYGDGEQSRDFCHVDNVCDANWLASVAPAECCDGRALNIACGYSATLNQIVIKLQELLATNVEMTYEDFRPGDVMHSLADVTRAKESIGYEPLIDFDEGLEKTIDWYRDNLGRLA